MNGQENRGQVYDSAKNTEEDSCGPGYSWPRKNQKKNQSIWNQIDETVSSKNFKYWAIRAVKPKKGKKNDSDEEKYMERLKQRMCKKGCSKMGHDSAYIFKEEH